MAPGLRDFHRAAALALVLLLASGTVLEASVERERELAAAARAGRWKDVLERLEDLWAVQDLARTCAPKVRAPVLLAVAKQDHVVDDRGARELARRLTQAQSVRFIELEKGAHVMPRDEGRAVLQQEVLAFLKRARTLDSGAPKG